MQTRKNMSWVEGDWAYSSGAYSATGPSQIAPSLWVCPPSQCDIHTVAKSGPSPIASLQCAVPPHARLWYSILPPQCQITRGCPPKSKHFSWKPCFQTFQRNRWFASPVQRNIQVSCKGFYKEGNLVFNLMLKIVLKKSPLIVFWNHPVANNIIFDVLWQSCDVETFWGIYSNCKIYLPEIARCICLKLTNVFVSNFNLYLSQIAKCICLKLQKVFVSNFKMYFGPDTDQVRNSGPFWSLWARGQWL